MTTDREQWLIDRGRYVTASDAAALLGIHPYKTLQELRAEKIGLSDSWAGDESTELALQLESFALQQAKRLYGWECTPHGKLVEDPLCSRLAATPDATMMTPWGNAVVQIKVTRSQAQEDCRVFTKSGRPTNAAYLNGCPKHYAVQVNVEMACVGTRLGTLLVLHTAPLKLRAYHVSYDDELVRRIREKTVEFWRGIEKGAL